jgi:hypothetical protein
MSEQLTPDSFLRVDGDIYGNPRYYVPVYVLPDDMSDKLRLSVGLEKYRGKKYGAGFIVQSYNLESTCKFINDGLKLK